MTNVLSIRTDFDKARTQRGDIYIKQGEYELAEKDLANNAEKRQLIQVCFTTFFLEQLPEVSTHKTGPKVLCIKIFLLEVHLLNLNFRP